MRPLGADELSNAKYMLQLLTQDLQYFLHLEIPVVLEMSFTAADDS